MTTTPAAAAIDANAAPAPAGPAPGPRAQKLDAVFAASITHTLSTLTASNVQTCFPSISPAVLAALTTQLKGFLEESAKREWEGVKAERNVVESLNGLDAVVEEAGRRKRVAEKTGSGTEGPIAPHTLPPGVILRAHLQPHYIQAQSKLNAKIQNAQARNEELIQEIREQRSQAEQLVSVLESVVKDLEGVGKEVGAVEMEM